MPEKRTKTILLCIIPSALLVYIFFIGLGPLSDPDLWWHLGTGRQIWEGKSLPEESLSYTAQSPLPGHLRAGMKSQWLGQLAFYIAYLSGGYAGVSVFRTLLMILPFSLLFIVLLRKGLNPLLCASFLVLPLLLISLNLSYVFERPQAFSFVFSLSVLVMLERLRNPQNGKKRHYQILLPLGMALWSNFHGAYIFGIALIIAFMAGEALNAAREKLHSSRVIRDSRQAAFDYGFFAACAAAIAFTGLNPNAYRPLANLIGVFSTSAGSVAGEVAEYKSLLFFYRELHEDWPIYLAAYIFMAAVFLIIKYISKKDIDFAEALTFSAIAAFAITYARGAAFALVLLPLYMGNFFAGLKSSRLRIFSAALPAALAAFMLFSIASKKPWDLRPEIPRSWVDESYPEGALRFVVENNIPGPPFNYMQWGGYMTWRRPALKVFLDARIIDNATSGAYLETLKGMGAWQSVLDAFNVNFVIMPVISVENGSLVPISLKMIKDAPDEWRVVYLKDNVSVFVRNTPANRWVIEKYGMPREAFFRKALERSSLLLSEMPGHRGLVITKAIALHELGSSEDAALILEGMSDDAVKNRLLEIIRGR